jgi:hypothetical protein
MMTVEDFGTTLDRLGSDLSRWPEALRHAAETLVARDAAAAKRLAEARRLHELLGAALTPAPVDAAQVGRILARVQADGRGAEQPLKVGSRFYAWTGGGLAACLAAGFIIGHAVPAGYGDQEIAELLFSDLAFSAFATGAEQ